MLGFCSVLVLAASFRVISSEELSPYMPAQCRRPPLTTVNPNECCKIPAFFQDEDFKDCGFELREDVAQQKNAPLNCTKQLCMMKKYSLLSDDGAIDFGAVGSFLDKWAKDNVAFEPAIDVAKGRCLWKQLPGPPQLCEPNKLVFCITATLFAECPNWDSSDQCKPVKEHFDVCTPHFFATPY